MLCLLIVYFERKMSSLCRMLLIIRILIWLQSNLISPPSTAPPYIYIYMMNPYTNTHISYMVTNHCVCGGGGISLEKYMHSNHNFFFVILSTLCNTTYAILCYIFMIFWLISFNIERNIHCVQPFTLKKRIFLFHNYFCLYVYWFHSLVWFIS